MEDDNKRDIIFLENFFKRQKDYPLKIKQPKKINNYDIFGKEGEKVEKPKRNNSQKLRAVNNKNNSFGVIHRKYNIIKESKVFDELNSKKNFDIISNIKNNYKNSLYQTISLKKSLNTTKFNSARNDNYLQQKSLQNIKSQYEIKLKNVSK